MIPQPFVQKVQHRAGRVRNNRQDDGDANMPGNYVYNDKVHYDGKHPKGNRFCEGALLCFFKLHRLIVANLPAALHVY